MCEREVGRSSERREDEIRPEVMLAQILETSDAISATANPYGPVLTATARVSPRQLRRLILKHWDDIAKLAHRIHDGDRRKSTRDRRA